MKCEFANNIMRQQIWYWLSPIGVIKSSVFYYLEYTHFMYVKDRCKIP